MPIYMDGNVYEDQAHLEAAFSPMLKDMGVDVKPLPPETGDNVDSKMVVTPNQMDTNKQLEQQDDAVLGGTEISMKRLYVSPNKTYDTQLTPEEEAVYSKRFGPNDSVDYDMRGWFKANPNVEPNAPGVHYPDTFKKPNHPTFSDQSQYSTDDLKGGTWGNENGKDYFIPSPSNLKNMSKEQLQDYFKKIEPDVELRMPLGASTEPAGEFKLRGGTEIPSYGEQGYTAISEPPKPDLEKEYLKRLTGTDNPRPAGDIVMDVLKNLNDKIMNAIKLPGDAWQGNIDPMSEEGRQRAADLAGLVVLGGVGRTLDAASVAGKPAFRPNPNVRAEPSLQDKLINGTATPEEISMWQQQPYRPEATRIEEAISGKSNEDIASEITKILAEWKAADKAAADAYKTPVTVKTMSPQEVADMKASWGKSDVDVHPQTQAMIDHFIKQPLLQKAETLPEKMTAKEAFKQAAEDAAAAFAATVGNIKSKFIEASREPVHEVPNIEKARAKGYDTPAYKGMATAGGQAPNPVYNFSKGYGEIYSTESPLLAEMYAGFLGTRTKAPRPSGPVYEDEFYGGAQVVPLLINTKDYHVYDAKGKTWNFVNNAAIDEARKLGKPGIIMQNVWDEPGTTTYLGAPKTVYITLPKGASTVKSRFAKNFDPTSPDMLNSIAAIGMVGAAGAVAFQEQPEPIDPNLPHK